DDVAVIVGDDNLVVRFAVGAQPDQSRSIEVDAVVVQEIRILAVIHAARAEPDLTPRLVDVQHRAHGPLAGGDAVLHGAGCAVDEVHVLPAVALRHPDPVLAVGDVVTVLLAGVALAAVRGPVVEEGLRLFGDDRPRLARARVDFDHAVDLVAALVVLERDRAA